MNHTLEHKTFLNYIKKIYTKNLKTNKEKFLELFLSETWDKLQSCNLDKIFKLGNYQYSSLFSKLYFFPSYINWGINITEEKNNYNINLLPSNDSINDVSKIKELKANKITQYKFLNVDDIFANVNFLMNTNFWKITIKNSLKKPIFINYKFSENTKSIYHPVLIFEIEANSVNVDFIQTFETKNSNQIINSNLVFINNKNSNIHFCSDISKNNRYINLINNISVVSKQASKFQSYILNTDGNEIRNNIFINLKEKNSYAKLNCAYIANHNRVIDNMTYIKHLAPHTTSSQLYKGIASNHGKGNFLGKIYVDHIAQKTESYQNSKNLLLSPKARINAKPQLEIFADDVKCSHGSTIGQLDPFHLFYLQTRGFSYGQSREYLINSFLREPFRNMDNNFLQEYFKNLI